MDDTKPTETTLEDAFSTHSATEPKRSVEGIVLVPQPSNDPRDPLNWPLRKKIWTLAIVSLASFIGLAQALANQSGFFVQGAVYHKTPVEMSYSISAAIVGLATGPLMWAPLSQHIGRSSCIFWGMLATLGMCIWSASMTGPGDYIPFVISRWLAGTFGSAPSTIGAGTILDIFFLHQRGKAFVCYTLFTLFGTQFGPTVGGFIIENAPWPVQFWWVVGVEGFVVILVLLFLQETRFPRDSSTTPTPQPPESYVSNRLRTFFPGTKVVPADLHRNSPTSTFLIALCPVTILSGLFLTITFGWAVAVTTLLSVFLQTPTLKGGYGFTPLQNACFSFAQWLGIGLAELYGMSVNDRIPLWMCKRSGKGVWKPEYRLFPLLIPPFIILPSAFGLFGAALQYHLHYMVLALAVFLINFCEVAIVPIVINYVVESFTDHAAEVTTVLNFYRLVLGLLVPFFILPWEARVGAGWVFGMMAFFAVFAFGFMAVLAWRGPAIRRLSFERFRRETEEGVNLNLGGSGDLGRDVEKK